ncbi:hypothetical protein GCM10009853_021420 [Glycomyces scopariae]
MKTPGRRRGRIAYATGPLAALALPASMVLDHYFSMEPVLGLLALTAGLLLALATGALARQAWLRCTGWLLAPPLWWLAIVTWAFWGLTGSWWAWAETVVALVVWPIMAAPAAWLAWSLHRPRRKGRKGFEAAAGRAGAVLTAAAAAVGTMLFLTSDMSVLYPFWDVVGYALRAFPFACPPLQLLWGGVRVMRDRAAERSYSSRNE